jgi:FtsX-like permease family
LSLILAADEGATVLAIIIGAIVAMSAMTMSFIERTRECGVLSALGWTRRRVGIMIMSEALLTGLIGTAGGLVLSVLAVLGVQQLPSLVGILQPVVHRGHIRPGSCIRLRPWWFSSGSSRRSPPPCPDRWRRCARSDVQVQAPQSAGRQQPSEAAGREPAVEMAGVCKYFDNGMIKALDGPSLRVERRVGRRHRAVGLRQVHYAPPDRRP